MQTFLPYQDYKSSARVIDYLRLGKQRVECLQILKALHDTTYGWQHHPAVKMWRGYEGSLVRYAQNICVEWIARGGHDTCLYKVSQFRGCNETPHWLTEEFCLSHQSNLIRKNPAYYRPLFPNVPDNLEYIWPISKH